MNPFLRPLGNLRVMGRTYPVPGKAVRLSRFMEDGRTLVVAMDHGLFGMGDGLERIVEVVEKVVEGGADAVMLNLGVARRVASRIGGRASLILTIPFDPKYVELAVKIGADGVKTTYFGEVPVPEERINQFAEIAEACEEWQMPYMAEVVPVDERGKTIYEFEPVMKAARFGSEVGGDIVKTAYVGPVEDYRRIVEACQSPIVVMGGERMEKPTDILRVVKEAVEAGAAGGAIGRNIWQFENPGRMAEALSRIIHEEISLEKAERIVKA